MGEKGIKKFKAARLVLSGEEGWQTASPDQTVAIIHGLDDPARRVILKLLDKGPIRQFELGELVSKALGKRYGSSMMRYHLKPLLDAGLIGFKVGPKDPRKKIVYRKRDFRIQFMEQPEPEESPIRSIETKEEFIRELKQTLK